MSKTIAFVEIPAVDFERTDDFYSSVFHMKMEHYENEKEKMAFFPEMDGAISFSHGFKPSADGTLASLNVPDSIAQTLARIVTPTPATTR